MSSFSFLACPPPFLSRLPRARPRRPRSFSFPEGGGGGERKERGEGVGKKGRTTRVLEVLKIFLAGFAGENPKMSTFPEGGWFDELFVHEVKKVYDA